MAQIKQVRLLINSLSKSEKRYFKCFCVGEAENKNYLFLFTLLVKDELSLVDIKQEFGKKFPAAIFEPACKHLYKMLMRSLRNYEGDKGVENKLISLLNDVKILFNKGIIDLCFSEINKAKELAWENEKLSYYLLFARLELQYLTLLEYPDTDEKFLVEKQVKINQVLYHEISLSRLSSLYELLTYRYLKRGSVHNEHEKSFLNDLLLEEFQINASRSKASFESEKIHLLFQSGYFLMTGSPNQSLSIYYKLNELFKKNKHLWKDSPVYYIYLLHGLLTDLQLMRRYKDMEFFLEELKQVHTATESLKSFSEQLVIFHQLGILNNKGLFTEALNKLMPTLPLILKNKNGLPPNAAAAMKLRISVVHFGLEEFTPCIKLINEVLNAKSKYISVQLRVLARLINLFVHIELQNDDYLVYEIKSLERKQKKETHFILEKITLTFLKKWLHSRQRLTAFTNYIIELEKLSDNNYENQLLQQFPIIPWAKSKISKASLSQSILSAP